MIPVPLPRITQFEKLAYGLFLHWGLYSQLGVGEWTMFHHSIPSSEYAKLKDSFTAKDFDARTLARFARESGFRYITLTTRHHDGFSLYDTRGLDDYDAPHSPAGRDLIAEFVDACRAEGIVPFFYHTTLDWRWQSQCCSDAKFSEYLDYLNASVEILCTHYGKIGGLWFDGNWSRPGANWQENRLYSMIRRLQPKAMIINNTGLSARGEAGHPELDSVTFEQGLPKPPDREGWPKYLAGEMCETINRHWGTALRDFNHKSVAQLIENLCACRKAGANYLLNVGLSAQGGVPELESAILKTVGQWINLSGDLIYRGKPHIARGPKRDFVLEMDGRLYYFAHDVRRRGNDHVVQDAGGETLRTIYGLDRPIQSVQWLDEPGQLRFAQCENFAAVEFLGYPYGRDLAVRIAELI